MLFRHQEKTMRALLCSTLVLCGLVALPATAADPVSLESLLAEMIDRDALAQVPEPHYICRQFSSYDRAGGNRDYLTVKAGETETLAEMKDAGCVKHIWVTIRTDEEWYLRKLVLRMYWDDE